MNFLCGGKLTFFSLWRRCYKHLQHLYLSGRSDEYLHILLRSVKWVRLLAWMLEFTLLVSISDFFFFYYLQNFFLPEFPYFFRHKVISKLKSHWKPQVHILSFSFCILDTVKKQYVTAKVNPLLALCGVSFQRNIKIHLFWVLKLLCFSCYPGDLGVSLQLSI